MLMTELSSLLRYCLPLASVVVTNAAGLRPEAKEVSVLVKAAHRPGPSEWPKERPRGCSEPGVLGTRGEE